MTAMKQYELMLVFRNNAGFDDEKKAKAFIEKITAGAHVLDMNMMGKRDLAYPIQKEKEGVYVLATLEVSHISVGAIEKAVKMGNEVLRYLLTAKEGGN